MMLNDANEVCRQLSFSRASGASPAAKFGEGSGTITSAVKDERHCCYSVPMMYAHLTIGIVRMQVWRACKIIANSEIMKIIVQ